jgi:hypothetical protein
MRHFYSEGTFICKYFSVFLPIDIVSIYHWFIFSSSISEFAIIMKISYTSNCQLSGSYYCDNVARQSSYN